MITFVLREGLKTLESVLDCAGSSPVQSAKIAINTL